MSTHNDCNEDTFEDGEYVVYPSRGVGQMKYRERSEVAGYTLEMYVIEFEKEKLVLRVPVSKADSVGMRKISSPAQMQKAFEVLQSRARVKRIMWSRRAQEYDAKINSGEVLAVAEVVRDLYRTAEQAEPSFSERQIYEAARERMAREVAAFYSCDNLGAIDRIEKTLSEAAASGKRGSRKSSKPEAANEDSVAAA